MQIKPMSSSLGSGSASMYLAPRALNQFNCFCLLVCSTAPSPYLIPTSSSHLTPLLLSPTATLAPASPSHPSHLHQSALTIIINHQSRITNGIPPPPSTRQALNNHHLHPRSRHHLLRRRVPQAPTAVRGGRDARDYGVRELPGLFAGGKGAGVDGWGRESEGLWAD